MALLDLSDDHDAAHLDAALCYVKDWSLAIDGGAHRGIFTRKLAARFKTVAAFEPVRENFISLPEQDCVVNYLAALGARVGTVLMNPGHENTGQWHIAQEWGDTILLPLDALNIGSLGFFKLDVEGYELAALKGADETLRAFKPVVMIEENGLCRRYGVEPGESQRFLSDMGYTLVQSIGRDLIFEYRSD